jgi:serine/threonine protein kinase
MPDSPAHPSSAPGSQPPAALPPGTRLGEFELRHVLGVGGFAIVYLAFDHTLEREVAVKEYMPTMLAGRTETLHVSLRSQGDAETFALGLKSFVNEARLLARFDLPSLVRVHRFWEANGTAYMAMPVVRGRSAKAWRQAQTHSPDEAWLRALMDPLLDTLEKLHGEAVYHRDIAPDNIQIDEEGRAVLLDLGAARHVIADATQTLTAILKPAYAPIEQYAEVGALRQGAWTDLYALGATLHYLLLGRPPLPATARAVHDELPPLAGQSLPGCSLRFLQVVDWMLSPRPQDRPRDVAMLRDALQGHIAPPEQVVEQPAAPLQWERTQRVQAGTLDTAGQDTLHVVVPSPLAAAARGDNSEADRTVLHPAAAAGAVSVSPPPPLKPEASAASPAPARRSRAPLMAGVAGLLVVLAVAGAWLSTGRGSDASAEGAQGMTSSPPPPDQAATVPAANTTDVKAEVPLQPSGTTLTDPSASGNTAFEGTGKPLAAPVQVNESGAQPSAPAPALSSPAVAGDTPGQRSASTGTANTPPVRRTPPPKRTAPAAEPRPAEVVPETPAQAAPPSAATLAVTPPPPEPAPVVVQAAPTPAPAVMQGPTERCGRRVLFALWNCIDRECRAPALRNHPECVKLREERERSVRGRF